MSELYCLYIDQLKAELVKCAIAGANVSFGKSTIRLSRINLWDAVWKTCSHAFPMNLCPKATTNSFVSVEWLTHYGYFECVKVLAAYSCLCQ